MEDIYNTEPIQVSDGQEDSQYEPELDEFKSKSRSTSVPLAQSNTGMATSSNLINEDINIDIDINDNTNEAYEVDNDKPLITLPICMSEFSLDSDFYQELPNHVKVHNKIIGLHPELRISHFFSVAFKDLIPLSMENDEPKFNKLWNVDKLLSTFNETQLQNIMTLKVKIQLQIDGLFSKFSISYSKLQKLYKDINLNKNPLATVLHKYIKQHQKLLDNNSLVEFSNACENLITQYEQFYVSNINNKRTNKLTNWYKKSAEFIKIDMQCLFDTIIGSSQFSYSEAIKIMIIWLDTEVSTYFTNRFLKIQNDNYFRNQKLQRDINVEKERKVILEDITTAINENEKLTISNLRHLIFSIVEEANNKKTRTRSRSISSRKSSKSPSNSSIKNNNKNKNKKKKNKNKNRNNNINQQRNKQKNNKPLIAQRSTQNSSNPRSVSFSGSNPRGRTFLRTNFPKASKPSTNSNKSFNSSSRRNIIYNFNKNNMPRRSSSIDVIRRKYNDINSNRNKNKNINKNIIIKKPIAKFPPNKKSNTQLYTNIYPKEPIYTYNRNSTSSNTKNTNKPPTGLDPARKGPQPSANSARSKQRLNKILREQSAEKTPKIGKYFSESTSTTKSPATRSATKKLRNNNLNN